LLGVTEVHAHIHTQNR